MTIYYGKFIHVCSKDLNGLDELMAFIDIKEKAHVKDEFLKNFKKLFNDAYSLYDPSEKFGSLSGAYELREIGEVVIGIGYAVKKIPSEFLLYKIKK